MPPSRPPSVLWIPGFYPVQTRLDSPFSSPDAVASPSAQAPVGKHLISNNLSTVGALHRIMSPSRILNPERAPDCRPRRGVSINSAGDWLEIRGFLACLPSPVGALFGQVAKTGFFNSSFDVEGATH